MWGRFDNTSCMNGLLRVCRKAPTTQAEWWADSLAQATQGIQPCSSHAGLQLRSRSICLPMRLRGDVRAIGIVESSRDLGPKLSVQPVEGGMVLAKMWRRRYPRVASRCRLYRGSGGNGLDGGGPLKW